MQQNIINCLFLRRGNVHFWIHIDSVCTSQSKAIAISFASSLPLVRPLIHRTSRWQLWTHNCRLFVAFDNSLLSVSGEPSLDCLHIYLDRVISWFNSFAHSVWYAALAPRQFFVPHSFWFRCRDFVSERETERETMRERRRQSESEREMDKKASKITQKNSK